MEFARNNLISIIVPCYNDNVYLLDNLRSLNAQTYRNFEIIIVNDGSNDAQTIEILESISLEFPSLQLHIISQENKGLPAARNRGVKESKGDWIVTLDADDMLAPEFLRKTYNYALSKELDFVVTDINYFGLQNFISRPVINLYEELFHNALVACAMFKRSILMKEKYDENFRSGFEDWELWIRILKNSYKGGILHEPLFYCRTKSESMLTKTNYNRPEIIKKIRDKHSELYTQDSLHKIKKNHKDARDFLIYINDIHYKIGLRFPRIGYALYKAYLIFRGVRPRKERNTIEV
jgi:glycosyltransferase involved in cell wall biosynthesis